MSLKRSIARNVAKNKYEYLRDKEKMSIVMQKAEVFRNGITEKDLEQEFKRGYGAGWEDGRERLYKTILASICLVMDEDGVPDDEIISFLRMVDNRVIVSIDEKEDLDEVFDHVGIRLHFKNVLDRIEEVKE